VTGGLSRQLLGEGRRHPGHADAAAGAPAGDALLETYYRELVDHVTRAGGSMGRYTAEAMLQDLEMAMVD
jgi:hypothetical protein